MPKKPTYGELQKRIAELEAQQQLLTEITERKRVEEMLRVNEQRYRTLIDSIQEGFYLGQFLFDNDGKPCDFIYLEVNPAFGRLMGLRREELIGRRVKELIPGIKSSWMEVLSNVQLTGEPTRHDSYSEQLQKHFEAFAFRPEQGQFAVLVTDVTERKQAEEALRASERRYSALFANKINGMAHCRVITDGQGRPVDYWILEINDAYERIIGIKKADIEGRKATEVFPDIKNYAIDYIGMYGKLALEGSEIKFEELFEATGQCLSIYAYSPVPGEFIAIFTDVTERKQAEEALRLAYLRLQTFFDQRIGGIGIVIANAKGDIVQANDYYLTILGVTRDELRSGQVDWRKMTPPEWLPEDERALAQLQERGVCDTYEKEYMRLDGSRVPVLITDAMMPDDSGDILAFVLDITMRKRAEEQVIQNQRTFSELVERAPFGIYVIDSQFCVAHMNARSQTGAFRNVKPLIGRDFSDVMRVLWPEPVAIEIIGHFRRTLETGEPYYSPRFTHPRHDVEIIESYEWELQRITLPDGQYGVICYYFDSTDLRNAELALQEANSTLERKVEERTNELTQRATQLRALAAELTLAEQRERSRLANVLHDHLQQLLVAAKFRLTILGRGGDEIIKQATKEVEELIDESIASSRSLTAELSPPILYEAGLNEGLQWLARRMVDTQGLFVDLELNESGHLPEDLRILLFQSVRELLFNVVKHANTRSAVVNLRRFDSSVVLIVSDQGVGFDPAAIPAAGEGGRGFGLFGIRERLELIGGTLEVQSNPGQGSRFVLSVPVASPTRIETQSQEILVLPEAHLMPSKYPDLGRKIRVILVDDHAVVRQGMANLLGDESDIEVVGQAADGQEAVELASKILPDVILMDMSMPKLNGVEATRIIHNDWPEIRIVGLSMFEEADRAQAMRDAGAVNYVTKSGPAEELINAIRTSVRASNKVLSATSQN
jgi:PAS domain S-box-containing protein